MPTSGSAIPSNAFALTPSDTYAYRPPLLGLKVTGAGYVTFLPAAQLGAPSPVSVVWSALAGEVIPVQMGVVYATGTTATGLIGLGPT